MISRIIVGLVLVSSLSGCMGHNALVSKTLKYNLSAAESRWGRETLFVGMWLVPVYPICALVDVLVLNSIEFWSGTNPVNGRSPLVDIPKSEVDKIGLDDIEVAKVERLNETQANLYIEFKNGDRATFDIIRDRDRYTVSYAGIEFFEGRLSL